MFSTTSPAEIRFRVLQAVEGGNTSRKIACLVTEQRRCPIHCAHYEHHSFLQWIDEHHVQVIVQCGSAMNCSHHGWNPPSERARRIVPLHFHYPAYQVRVVASPIMMKLAYTARAWHTLCSAM